MLDALNQEPTRLKPYNPKNRTRMVVPLPDDGVRKLEEKTQNTYKWRYAVKWRKFPENTLSTISKDKAPGTEWYVRSQKHRYWSTIPDMIEAGAKVKDIDEGLKNGTLQQGDCFLF